MCCSDCCSCSVVVDPYCTSKSCWTVRLWAPCFQWACPWEHRNPQVSPLSFIDNLRSSYRQLSPSDNHLVACQYKLLCKDLTYFLKQLHTEALSLSWSLDASKQHSYWRGQRSKDPCQTCSQWRVLLVVRFSDPMLRFLTYLSWQIRGREVFYFEDSNSFRIARLRLCDRSWKGWSCSFQVDYCRCAWCTSGRDRTQGHQLASLWTASGVSWKRNLGETLSFDGKGHPIAI